MKMATNMQPDRLSLGNFLFFILLCLIFLASVNILMPGQSHGTAAENGKKAIQNGTTPKKIKGPVCTVKIQEAITPASYELLHRAIESAINRHASLLIVELDTPGGLVTSMRRMIQDILASPVPVAVYVAPSGAQAASAGTFITMAAHIAAMAPGTNIGAAHPVEISGKMKKDSVMGEKVENDMAAMAKAIAQQRNRNIKWAEEAVRKSVSITATEALKLKVIDLIARDKNELISKLQGRTVDLRNSRVILQIDKEIIEIQPTLRDKLLRTISDPNIAYIFMMIGIVGLYFEITHPGTMFPGIVGFVSLILGLYAMHTLEANTVGLMLIAVAVILFIMELFIVSHGVLGAGGIICLVLGSIMLFDKDVTGFSISNYVLWPTVATVSGAMATILFIATRALVQKPKTGSQGLLGEEGYAMESIHRKPGSVFIHGEIWQAISKHPIDKGAPVRVTAVHRLKLEIEPVDGSEDKQ